MPVTAKAKEGRFKSCINNQDGFIFGMMLFVLALFGAWFLYQSFAQGQLKDNVKAVFGDYLTILAR